MTLAELRHKTHQTQAQVAARIGITERTYARWESRKHKARRNYYPSLARALRVTVDVIEAVMAGGG